MAQFYLASKGKYILEEWGQADPKDTKRRETQRLNFGSSFYTFFLLPLSLSYVNWASQEACCFACSSHSDPWTFLPSIFLCFPFFVFSLQFSSVQSLSRVRLFATPWTAARQASLSITNAQNLQLLSIESVMPSNHLILCRPLLLLPSIFPSMRVFSNEPVLHIRWQTYCSLSFSISPSSEHSGLLSFRMDWLDCLAVQGTHKSLLQHRSSKASILQHSAFFIVQRSHPYMTIGKTIALTRWTFVGKVMSLLFNMLSRLVITFLPISKHLLISRLQLPSAVILEPPKIKSATVSTMSPSICMKWWDWMPCLCLLAIAILDSFFLF